MSIWLFLLLAMGCRCLERLESAKIRRAVGKNNNSYHIHTHNKDMLSSTTTITSSFFSSEANAVLHSSRITSTSIGILAGRTPFHLALLQRDNYDTTTGSSTTTGGKTKGKANISNNANNNNNGNNDGNLCDVNPILSSSDILAASLRNEDINSTFFGMSKPFLFISNKTKASPWYAFFELQSLSYSDHNIGTNRLKTAKHDNPLSECSGCGQIAVAISYNKVILLIFFF